MIRHLGISFLAGVALVATLGACGSVKPVTACETKTDSVCFEGYTCDLSRKICVRSCDKDSDCLSSQVCDLTDVDRGLCLAGVQQGDTTPSPSPGDSSGGD